MPQTGVEHMGDVGHKMLGKELKSRENRQKRLKSIGKTMRQLFVYCGAIFALPEAFFFGYSGAIFGRSRSPFH
jgi:hypothetical protein